MNITEKQKEIMLSYMRKYPDFGRGRLRYNSENKRKIDGLWEQLTTKLNMSACGPSKSAKEWSKTWRDWKSNMLKKVAKHKAYMMGTGGGSPKNLQLTAVENALLDFLTPDASGLSNISEGGFDNEISCNNPEADQYYSSNLSPFQKERRLKERRFIEDLNQCYSSTSSVQEDRRLKEDVNQYYSSTLSSVEDESNIDKICLSDSSEDLILRSVSQTKRMQSPIMDKKQPKTKKHKTLVPFLDNNTLNMYKNKENIQDKDNQRTPLDSTKYQNINAKYFEDIKKPNLMTTAINILDKKTSTSENIKLQLFGIKREKLQLKKEEIGVQKDMLQQLQDINTTLSSLREELSGQYLTADT